MGLVTLYAFVYVKQPQHLNGRLVQYYILLDRNVICMKAFDVRTFTLAISRRIGPTQSFLTAFSILLRLICI